MFCPRCGSSLREWWKNQSLSEELKFCKSCGANLYAVRQVLDTRETRENFDWSNTWVAEIFRSSDEIKRRKAELERQRGITPEVKRYNEIKAGVITASLGVALALFLSVFMEGIILGANIRPETAEILSRLWIAGVIPLFVGIALIVNGVFVSKKLVEVANRPSGPPLGLADTSPQALRPADTNEFIPSGLSVTEETTRHLRTSDPESKHKPLI